MTKLLDGVFEDDTQFGIIYGLDDGDDWTSESALIKANPNWGISVRPEVLVPLIATAMPPAHLQPLRKWQALAGSDSAAGGLLACRTDR